MDSTFTEHLKLQLAEDGSDISDSDVRIDTLVLQVLALRSVGMTSKAIEKCLEACALSDQRSDLVFLASSMMDQAEGFTASVELLAPTANHSAAPMEIVKAYAMALEKVGRKREALDQFKRVITANGSDLDILLRAAKILATSGKDNEASDFLIEKTESHPDKIPMLIHSAALLADQGNREQALIILNHLDSTHSFSPGETMIISGIRGINVPEGLCAKAARHLFDNHAATYDSNLASLDYAGPEIIARAIEDAKLIPTSQWQVLDAGCGTGLCGSVVKPYAARIVGVDLSDQMLERAKAQACYAELVNMDLVDVGERYPSQFDLIVSADVLCYSGDLSLLLSSFYTCLRTDGYIAFTVEAISDTAKEYELKPSGRYGHCEAYLTKTLREAGFSDPIVTNSVTLRTQYDETVAGTAMVAMKSVSAR